MGDLLNSPFVNQILKLALSRAGIWATLIVNWIMGLLAGTEVWKLLSETQQHDFQDWLGKGLLWLFTALIGWFTWWIQHRQKDGVRALQAAHNQATPQSPLKIDGIAGNETVKEVATASGTTVHDVVIDVKAAKAA